jgi:hypothetical protein
MSIALDVKYARMLNLLLFRETHKNHFNFRCPFCKDSQKSKTKKRAYLIPTKDKQGLYFNCFNCHEPIGGMSYFIFKISPTMAKNYNREKFEENRIIPQKSIVVEKKDDLVEIQQILEIKGDIENVIELESTHRAVKYLQDRKVAIEYWSDIFYTKNYKKWIVDNYLPEMYKSVNREDERLIFPLYTKKGELIGFQGRSLDPTNEVRYLTVKIKDTEYPLVYGINKIVLTNLYIFLAEGIFDSLMLKNSMAMLKSDMNLNFMKENFSSQKTIFIFDNEPHNKFIVRNYEKIANLDEFGLFIWPKDANVKDLNDLAVKKSMSSDEIEKYVKGSVIFGKMQKILKLSQWKI